MPKVLRYPSPKAGRWCSDSNEQGLSKQDRMIHFGSKFFVPSVSENKKLDPKKALNFYLKRTNVFRKTSKDISKPPRITKVPDLDLHKVLGMLHKAHFEPLI